MQVMGGMGYSIETLVEYCFRKTRGWLIAGGSMEMMKNRIAEGVFDRRFSQRPPKPAKTDKAAEYPNVRNGILGAGAVQPAGRGPRRRVRPRSDTPRVGHEGVSTCR